MSTPAGIVGKMLAGGATEAVSFAAGVAIAPTLAPVLQELENTTWPEFPVKPPPALTLASGVAQGQVDEQTARDWAKQTGFGDAAMTALIDIANTGPALGLAYAAWRRDELTDAEFTTALKRTGLEEQWFSALRALKQNPLEPGEIAKAVHRGIMADDGLLVAAPPTTPGKVPAVPPSDISPITEASWSGLDAERLRILVGNAGLPPGIVQMLQLLNRGEITEDDFLRGVGESNLRNEWGPAILALRRHLLTPHEYEEAALRGIITNAEADAGAGLSGMQPQDAQLLFQIMGRPLAVHQITTGLERGGQFGGTYADVPEPYRDAIRRSNIRPEYARLAYANRYTIPSYFILRAILQAGGMTEAQFAEYGKQLGWPPDLAEAAAAALGGGGGSGTDAHAAKAQTQLWTTLHRAYLAGEIDEATAQATLPQAGVDAAAAPAVLATWDVERGIVRKQLTPAQIKKAWSENVLNADTGAAWTRDEAIAALISRGYSSSDANTFLEI